MNKYGKTEGATNVCHCDFSAKDGETELEHRWERVNTWEGDPALPGGTNGIKYWWCKACDLETNDPAKESDICPAAGLEATMVRTMGNMEKQFTGA